MTDQRFDPSFVAALPGDVTLIVAAEGCYAGLMTPQQCAGTLYQAYQPTANDLADVMLAVWTTIAPADMTTLLRSYYTPEQAQQATMQAYSYYLDVMVRDTLIDQGQIPYPYNDVWQSPDVYPVGTTPLPDPQTLLTTWNQGPSANIITNSSNPTNYIYVRTTNLFPGATPWYADPQTGQLVPNQIYLHWALASLILMPSQWGPNLIPTAPNQMPVQPATMAATTQGQHVIALPAFQWVTAQPPAGDHYCLIARVVSYGHPNPVPPDGSLTNFCDYVRDNPCVAWRNVTVVYSNSQRAAALRAGREFGDSIPFTANLVLANPEATATSYVVQVVATNMPIGTTIQLTSADTALNLGPVTVQQASQNWQVTASLPANYSGTLIETIVVPDGATLTMGATVSVINYAVASQNTELHARGRVPAFYRMNAAKLGLPDDDNVVFVGNFDTQFVAGSDPFESA